MGWRRHGPCRCDGDEVEDGMVREVPNTDLPDVTRHPLDDSIRHAAERLPGVNTTGIERKPRVTELPWKCASASGAREKSDILDNTCSMPTWNSSRARFEPRHR